MDRSLVLSSQSLDTPADSLEAVEANGSLLAPLWFSLNELSSVDPRALHLEGEGGGLRREWEGEELGCGEGHREGDCGGLGSGDGH